MKVFIFSHDADIDGMGPIVLGKLVFDDVDYCLVNYNNIDEELKKRINDGTLDEYDAVYVTDVCPKRETLEYVKNFDLKDKFQVIDHHDKSMANKDLDFCKNIEVQRNNVKTCATELFRRYILENFTPDKVAGANVAVFTELTRLSDTWDWKKENVEIADDLAELFNAIGAEKYIDSMTEKLKKGNAFTFSNEEWQTIDKRRKMLDKIYNDALACLHIEDVDGVKVAVSQIGHDYVNNFSQLLRDQKIDADVLAVPMFDRGSMSYRYLREGFDVNQFAQKFGGGGSKAAAGSPINELALQKFAINPPEDESSKKED